MDDEDGYKKVKIISGIVEKTIKVKNLKITSEFDSGNTKK